MNRKMLFFIFKRAIFWLCDLHPFWNPWDWIFWKWLTWWYFMKIFKSLNSRISTSHYRIEQVIGPILFRIWKWWLSFLLIMLTHFLLSHYELLWVLTLLVIKLLIIQASITLLGRFNFIIILDHENLIQ